MVLKHGKYKPCGPLAYLLMDSEGEMVLGIYESVDTGALVFLLRIDNAFVVIKPGRAAMDSIMSNEFSLVGLLGSDLNIIIEDMEGNRIINSDIQSDSYIKSLDYPLDKIKDHILLPNYYYTYKDHVFNKINS